MVHDSREETSWFVGKHLTPEIPIDEMKIPVLQNSQDLDQTKAVK